MSNNAPEAVGFEAPFKPSPMSSPRLRLGLAAAGLAVAVAGAAWGWGWWVEGRFIQSTDNAYLAADAVVVAPRVAGYVEGVAAADNSAVTAGALLVRIDAGPIEAAVEAARADVSARQADVLRLEAEVRAQAAVIDQARAEARVVGSRTLLAETEARRAADLAAIGADTAQRRDEAVSGRDQARAEAEASAAAVRTAEARIQILRAQIVQARAAVAAAQARLEAALLDLEATEIRAPRPGRVGDRTVQPGEYVQPGARLMTLVPSDDLYLEANFKETQMARIRPGQPVEVRIDALGDRPVDGVVDSVAPGTGSTFALLPPENATGNFTKIVQRVPIRIRLRLSPEEQAPLSPGLSAVAAVDTRSAGR